MNKSFLTGAIFLLAVLIAPQSMAAAEKAAPEEKAVEADSGEKIPEKTEGVTYSPDFCEFAVTFPSAPYTAQRCDDVDKEKCYNLVSYTQVYALTSTVNFRIICNPINKEVAKQFTPEVMKTTLHAMTRDSVVKEFDTSFSDQEQYKQAGLVGEGKVGRTSTIYLAQLWIGEQSALSVEAELIGDVHPESDKIFSDVLKSIHFSGDKGAKTDKKEKKKPEPDKND